MGLAVPRKGRACMSREQLLEEIRRNPAGRTRDEVRRLLESFGFTMRCTRHWKAKIDPGDGGPKLTVMFPNHQSVLEVYVRKVVDAIDELLLRREQT